MLLTKLQLVAVTVLCAGVSLATVGGMLVPAGLTQDARPEEQADCAGCGEFRTRVRMRPREDAKKLEGEWRAVEMEVNGKKDSSAGVKDLRMIFKDHEITLKSASHEGRERKKKFKLDTRSSPKGIDITSLDGQEEGQTAAGIYSLEEGRLRLCIPDRPKDPSKRPTDFRTRDGDGLMLLVLERVPAEGTGSESRPQQTARRR